MSNFILKTLETRELKLNTIRLRGFYGGKLRKGSGGGGSGDGFPVLPGDVTRWHFGGLTNEMMAAMDDPRIEDADHKGRFLSFKNFAWSGMSGVGGYVQNFNYFRNNTTVDKVRIDEQSSNSIKVTILNTEINNAIYIPKNIYQFNKSYFIKISSEGYNEGDLSLSFYASSISTATTVRVPLNPNGITEIPAIKEDDFLAVYINVSGKVGSFTVEQLPLYPGALVFDGVDDYGVCENFPILTKEKGYTVVALRQYLFNATDKVRSLVTNAPSSIVSRSTLTFELIGSNGEKMNFSFGKGNLVSDFEPNVFSYMTSKSYNGKTITPGDVTESNKRILVGNFSENGKRGSNVAIWELVFLDHDATEEELTKIKDYFVKTYPWLFPNQAWTVTGKTNEDEDRATIANITGNGNDLVLSNFGFAEGSGYGLYKTPFELYPSVQHSSKYSLSFSKFALGDHNLIIAPKQNDLSYDIKVKVTGLKDGVKFKWGWIGTTGYIDITTDGIHMLNKPASQIRQLLVEFAEDFDPDHVVTIEQIPEYEGYLVTDGVDDKIASSDFKMGKDFTIVGDWKFINNKKSATGLVKGSSFYIYNTMTGLDLYINSGSVKNSLDGIKSINAACSDGRAYDRNWNEILANTGNVVGSGGTLEVSSSGGRFDRIAFKNLAIYPRILSKDDCIKAYNYLQTLKAK